MSEHQATPWDGLPLHPERDGWHWLVPAINTALPPGAYRWHAPPRADVVGQWDAGHPLDVVRRGYAYAGPCVMPDDAARLRAEVASLRAALRRIVQECGRARGDQGHRDASRFAFAIAYKAAGEGVADG